jgi:hypothetical protein
MALALESMWTKVIGSFEARRKLRQALNAESTARLRRTRCLRTTSSWSSRRVRPWLRERPHRRQWPPQP